MPAVSFLKLKKSIARLVGFQGDSLFGMSDTVGGDFVSMGLEFAGVGNAFNKGWKEF